MAFYPPGVGATVEISELESLAKGSLIVGDGSGAPAELTVGSNGAIIQALSTEATGLIWRTSPQLVDQIAWTTGTAVTAASYSIGRDADATNQLHFNVPTGATFEFSVNDTSQFDIGATFSRSNQQFISNGDISTNTGIFHSSSTSTARTLSLKGGSGSNTWAPTSGTSIGIEAPITFNPTSGTGKLVGFGVSPIINQTGTATGDYTGFLLNVTETAVTGTNKMLVELQIGGTNRWAITNNGSLTVTENAITTGTQTLLTFTGAAHTGLTAATEVIGINFNQSATKTWAAGAGPLATQREVVFQAPTYAGNAGGALTITQAATVAISGPPIQGTNMTLTATDALWVQSGRVRLDDAVHWNTGVAIVAGDYSIGRDADGTNQLHFNVPTGATFEWSVNDAVEMTLSASAVNFQNNSLTTTGGGSLTGTWTDLGTVTTIDINGGTVDGVTIGGASAGAITGTTITANTGLLPDTDGGAYLGQGTQAFSSLFLDTGGVINFDNGDVTITHSSNVLTFASATGGYAFDAYISPTAVAEKQGSDIASANNATLVFDGNYFDITGTTQTNTLSVATGVVAGTRITLQFDGSVTVKHATAGTGAQFWLASASDFAATAGDKLWLEYDGTYWKEGWRFVA